MQAFSNIRIIDLTHVIAGPFCTYQLAVMGADVIKIEPPNSPDMSRTSGAPSPADAGLASDFTAQNANKRSVCIDLKTARGVEVVRRLLATADVFVENYRSGAMAKVGLDYPAVAAVKPDIIYCAITGFGQRGPNAERTAYDNVIQAYSGLMAATGDAHSAPLKVGPPVLDYGTGIQAAFAIAAALYQRSVTAKGQFIDVAMLDAAIMLMSSHVTRWQQCGELSPLSGNNSAFNAGYGCYPTGDGLLMLGANTGKQMAALWAVLGVADAGAEDMTEAAMRTRFNDDRRRIAAILLTQSAEFWEREFNRRRVPAARVRRLDEALTDRQLESRSVLRQPPGADAQALPVAAFQTTDNGPALTRPPPRLAQHTDEVLREIGYDERELAQLQDEGVIKRAATVATAADAD